MTPPPELHASNDALVWRTATIVLAKAVKVEKDLKTKQGRPDLERFEFETVRVLKGSDPKQFSLNGYASDKVYSPGDFSAHHRPEFWAIE